MKGHLSYTLFGVAAFVSFLLSVMLWFDGNEQQAIFVGLWVPSILALGAYASSAARARARS